MPRNAGNRAEKLSQGAAQAKRTSAFTMFDYEVRCKTLRLCRDHAACPPGRENTSEHGPGGTCLGRSESFGEEVGPAGAPSSSQLQPLPPPAGRPAPRPGRSDPSPATGRSSSPVPVESVPRTCRKQLDILPLAPPETRSATGPQALAAPPARLALTTDLAREPLPSRTEWGTPMAGARRRPLTLME